MRYFQMLSPKEETDEHTYSCDHQIYNNCTLYAFGARGLAVIQQQYDSRTKRTWWGAVSNKKLVDDILNHPRFEDFFDRYSGYSDQKGCYPTVTIRQIMWGLRMKPLPKQRWETVFDHKPV